MMTISYVQYGCGWSAPTGWRNFDSSPALRFERLPLIGRVYTKNKARFPKNAEYGDIVKGLPVPPNSCNGVYCSHVLEHLSLVDFRIALQNTHLILSPGGTFRLVLPDLEYLINQYVSTSSSNAAPDFMKQSCLGRERRPRGLKDFIISWLGNSNHLWMWDYKSIETELINEGFADIRRAYAGDSSDQRFKEVEEKLRWEHCLGIECKKPR